MKKFIVPILIFILTFLIYYAVGTQFSFKPKWALDHFNPLAKSLLSFRLDIQNPTSSYDLSYFNGKWYVPWGVLASIFLIPLQLIKGRFIPIFYLSIFFSSLNIVFVYFLLKRIKKEFLPKMSRFALIIFLILFAFGTTHFYVGTLGSSWHVNQIVTSFLGTLGIFIIFKRKRTIRDYLFSSIILSSALLGRFTVAVLLVLPIFLYLTENYRASLKTFFMIFIVPFCLFLFSAFSYNYLRFNNPLEFGYSYIKEAPNLALIREENGLSSLKNLPKNIWLMLFEVPKISFTDKFNFNFNLNGNSIFFLTAPFLAIFLAKPVSRYIWGLWIGAIFTIIPSLLHYSSGWMQFGYRYSLDITVLLLLLTVFGTKGKVNFLFLLGVIFSIIMYFWGITLLS